MLFIFLTVFRLVFFSLSLSLFVSVDYIFIGFWLIGYFVGFLAAHFVHCILSAAYAVHFICEENAVVLTMQLWSFAIGHNVLKTHQITLQMDQFVVHMTIDRQHERHRLGGQPKSFFFLMSWSRLLPDVVVLNPPRSMASFKAS